VSDDHGCCPDFLQEPNCIFSKQPALIQLFFARLAPQNRVNGLKGWRFEVMNIFSSQPFAVLWLRCCFGAALSESDVSFYYLIICT
jgi:hypothetical protein